jgi:phenylpropionate dioxygenase-like ring-hydroxylating dioxygenase large terminal subunit
MPPAPLETRRAVTPREAAGLLDDHPEEGVFRVHRRAFTDPAVLAFEIERIFEGTWVYLALASEVPAAHDFITRPVGRQSVLLTRGADGTLRALLNSCRHRGTLLASRRAGSARFHVCPYHGWTYDSAGRCVAVTEEAHGQYPQAFSQDSHDLVPVARLGTYRGFVFVSLNPDVPSLDEHLGEARRLLDLVADQAPDGLEIVPGSSAYVFEGNWKLQFENGLEGYHFPTTHAAFVDIVRARAPAPLTDAEPAQIRSGSISLPRGHAMTWSVGAPGQGAQARPLPRDPALLERVRARVGEARLSWMLRQRNLTLFPNLQVIDIQSLQLRTWEPLAVDRTRMRAHCLAPCGESPAARRFRIRQYEEFFGPGGLASADDNVMYELSQPGLAAAAGDTQGYARGLAPQPVPDDAYAALELASARRTFSAQGLGFGDESAMHAGYREWLRLLTRT